MNSEADMYGVHVVAQRKRRNQLLVIIINKILNFSSSLSLILIFELIGLGDIGILDDFSYLKGILY